MRVEPKHYLEASEERIDTARRLHNDQRFVPAIYFSGLAVECLLRAYRSAKDQQFDARHDLKELLKASGIADFIPRHQEQAFAIHFGQVWSRWKNDYRFASEERLRAEFRRLQHNRGIKGDFLKRNAEICVDSAFTIISMGSSNMAFKDELTKILSEMNLPNAIIELEVGSGRRVGGFIISSAFKGKSQIERQDMIWDFLDSVLPKNKRARIIALLTLTPDEADMAA